MWPREALVAEVERLRVLVTEVVPNLEWLMSERDSYDLEENGCPALLEKLKAL